MNEQRFAIRTIRNERVKIGGRWFRPKEAYRPYQGELDGQRMAFGRYPMAGGFQPFVSMWGTEAMYRAQNEAQLDEEWERQPHHIDGYVYWEWWDAEPDTPDDARQPRGY